MTRILTDSSRTRLALFPILAGASLLVLCLGTTVTHAALPARFWILDPGFPASDFTGRSTQYPDLQIDKTGPATVLPGAAISYTLRYTNAGDLAADAVVVTDTLPAGLSFVTADPPSAAPAGGVITWSLGTVISHTGSTLVVTATAQADLVAGTILTNTAVISSSSADGNPDNNVAQAGAQVVRADLVLLKTGPQFVLPGQQLTYTLTYGNAGTAPAASARLTDTLPAVLGGESIVRELGTLGPGVTGTLAITATVPPDLAEGTTFTNTAQLGTTTPETNLANNQASVGTTVRAADVRITKAAPFSVQPTGNLTYSLGYSNLGSARAEGVRVTDTLPLSVTFVGATPAPSAGAGRTWTWQVGALDPGNSGAIQVIATISSTVRPGTRVTNTASISTLTPDGNPANDTAQAGTQVFPGPAASLLAETASSQLEVGGKTTVLTATVRDAWGNFVQDGTLVEFSVFPGSKVSIGPPSRLTYNGVATATVTSQSQPGPGLVSVTVGALSSSVAFTVVPGPPNAILLTASQPQRTVGQSVIIYAGVVDRFGNQVANGTSVVFSTTLGTVSPITATTVNGTASTSLTSTRSGTASVVSRAGTAYDEIDVVFLPGPAASLSGEASPNAVPIEGGQSTLRVHVTDQYSNTVLNGTQVTFQTSLGSVSPAQAGTSNGTATTTLTAGPQYGTAVVTATVGSVKATVPVVFQPADVRLVKTVSDSPFGTVYVPGQPVTFSLAYSNNGAATARSVLITDVLPSELVSPTWTIPPGTTLVSSQPLVWQVGNLSAGAGGEILVRGRIPPDFTGTLVNTASASTATAEQDRSNNNGTAGVTVALGDVSILKQLNPNGTNAVPGGTLRYTITYLDNGLAPAIGVRITDTLPDFTAFDRDDRTFAPGLQLVSVDDHQVVWAQDGLVPGNARFYIWLRINPDAPGGFLADNVIDIGTLTPESAYDDNESEDTSARIAGVNVSLFQSAPFQIQPDRLITYTITYLNNGTVPAENVILTDTLPDAVTYLSETADPSISPSTGDGRRRTWHLGTLAADPQGTFPRTIRVTAHVSSSVPAGTVLGNVATATTTTPESHTADNTSTFLTTVVPDEPFSISVVARDDQLPVGGATTPVKATLRDRFGNPVSPTTVNFAATGGTISPAITTTLDGIASTTFSSGPLVGTAYVTATVEGGPGEPPLLRDSTSIQVLPDSAYTLTLTPHPPQLVADGVSTSTVDIAVVDRFGNWVAPTDVALSASGGTINPASVRTTDGQASAIFRAGTVARTATVTATADSRVGTTNIVLRGGLAYTVTLDLSFSLLPADGSDYASVTVTAIDRNRNPVPDDTRVTFTSTLGIISPTIASTVGGVATATIRGDTRAGQATVTASVDARSASQPITFMPGVPTAVAVSADPPVLEANGVSTATIQVDVTDRYANHVYEVPVVLTTTLGTLARLNLITNNGVARTVLTAGSKAGTAIITATVPVDGGVITGSTLVPMSSGEPAILSLAASPSALTANGVATATLGITLTDRSGNPVHNVPVSLSAVGGVVSPSVVTVTIGHAWSVFRAGTVARPATVTATTGALTQTTTIDLHPGTPAHLAMRVQPDVLTANGTATATLGITVTDAYANLVADDTLVNLTTTLGSLNPTEARTQSGVARSILKAGTRSGTAVITAMAGQAQANTTATLRPGPPFSVTVSSDPRQLTADGVSTATVTAQVADQYANLVRDGTPVLFSASRGRLDPEVVLTRDGLARSVYTADTHAGRAVILATAGTVDGAASVDLLPGLPFSITLAAEPLALTVGPDQQAVLRGRVSDRFDNAVADGTLISLTTTLGQLTSPVGTTDGEFVTILTAGTRSGTTRITARSGTASTHLDMPIRPGPTETVSLTAFPTELVADGVATATLTITATDQYANPVVDDTPVSLTASGGTVTPASTATHAGGANGTFRAGTVVGTATVTATVEGRTALTAIGLVPGAPFSVTVQVEPDELPVGQNATADVRVYVTDRYANPVADGTPVSVTSTLGTLSGFRIWASSIQNPKSKIENGEEITVTTSSGVATATLTAGDVAGQALVTARAGSAVGQAEVAFQPGPPASIDLSANPNRVPADGESVAYLVARVTDGLGNGVADGVIVLFVTTSGTFEGGNPTYATTTHDGQAEADLRAPLTLGRATVTARADSLQSSVDVEFVIGPPYTVTLAVMPDRLPADGVSTAILTATIRDQQDRLVEDGTPVVFETDYGRLGASQVITVATSGGVATATLTAAGRPARARVRVTAGLESAEAEVAFIGKLFMPQVFKQSRLR